MVDGVSKKTDANKQASVFGMADFAISLVLYVLASVRSVLRPAKQGPSRGQEYAYRGAMRRLVSRWFAIAAIIAVIDGSGTPQFGCSAAAVLPGPPVAASSRRDDDVLRPWHPPPRTGTQYYGGSTNVICGLGKIGKPG